MVNEGNSIASASIESSPEACGERCDKIVNCNSFAFCNEVERVVTCYPKDKLLVGTEEMNKPSNCASYKNIGGKYS